MSDDPFLLPDLDLWYGSVRIGRISQVTSCHPSWIGLIEHELDRLAGAGEDRLVEFIEFCIDWDTRAQSANHGDLIEYPDASEFEAFTDILQSGEWRIHHQDGRVEVIDEAPMFSLYNEVSWSVVEER
jgi:hypothetical protein